MLEKEREHAFFNRAFVLFLRLFVTSSLSKKDVPFGKLEMKRYKVLRTQNKLNDIFDKTRKHLTGSHNQERTYIFRAQFVRERRRYFWHKRNCGLG